jgi:PKD repeat protein
VDVTFSNLSEGADDYLWDFGDGRSSKDTDPQITYSDYGDFSVSLIATNMFNCMDTAEMLYHAYHNPVADFAVDTTIGCDPFIVPFTNLSEYGLEYYWTFGDQGTSQLKQPVFAFKGEGVYSVSLTVIGQGGCRDSIFREDFLVNNPSPIADFSYTRINQIDTVQFHNYSGGAIAYVWNFGDGQSSEETEPWHRYANYGSYVASLTAVNEYDCKHTKYETIDFELFKGLFLPNAFSPDNISEDVREFRAVGIGLIEFHLVVYDAWGNLLWETTELEKGAPVEAWDGTYKGEPLPPDVYVWHLKEAVFKDGSTYDGERYGTITLIK